MTRVPPKYEALIDPPVVSSFTARSVEQTVRWPGVVRRPLRVQVWYRLAPARPGGPFRDVAIPYLPEESGVAEGNRWRVLAQLSRDAGAVTKQLSIADLPALYGVGMKLSFADSSWVPPGGVFDPDILIEPGTFTNVEGGFGFFGAVAQLNAEWTLTRAATEAAGYPWPNP